MSSELALSTNDIFISSPIVEVDGQVDDMVQTLLIGMDMTESEQGLSSMELKFINTATLEGRGNDFAFEYSDNDLLSIGKPIKVWTGDHNDPKEIFRGTISGIEMVIGGFREPRLHVLAEDALQKARLKRQTRLHHAGSIRSIIQPIFAELGLRTDISGMDQQVDAQLQFNESDLAFIRRILDRFDCDLKIAGDVLQMAPRSDIRHNEVTLEQGSQLLSVRILADLAHQASKITYAGWDVAAGREIKVESNVGADLGPGQGRSGDQLLKDAFGERSEHLSHAAAQNQSEAQALVNSNYSQRARKFVCAEGVAEGNPSIRMGTHLTLKGIGPRFENTYYVTKVRHHYNQSRGYRTMFHAECAFLGD